MTARYVFNPRGSFYSLELREVSLANSWTLHAIPTEHATPWHDGYNVVLNDKMGRILATVFEAAKYGQALPQADDTQGRFEPNSVDPTVNTADDTQANILDAIHQQGVEATLRTRIKALEAVLEKVQAGQQEMANKALEYLKRAERAENREEAVLRDLARVEADNTRLVEQAKDQGRIIAQANRTNETLLDYIAKGKSND